MKNQVEKDQAAMLLPRELINKARQAIEESEETIKDVGLAIRKHAFILISQAAKRVSFEKLGKPGDIPGFEDLDDPHYPTFDLSDSMGDEAKFCIISYGDGWFAPMKEDTLNIPDSESGIIFSARKHPPRNAVHDWNTMDIKVFIPWTSLDTERTLKIMQETRALSRQTLKKED